MKIIPGLMANGHPVTELEPGDIFTGLDGQVWMVTDKSIKIISPLLVDCLDPANGEWKNPD